LPTRMNGTLGEEAQRAQAFAAELEAQLRIPVVLWDERLTTVRAERLLREGGKRKRRTSTDVAAATILLQDYLDSLKAEPL
ncbi:MAG: Holliday junction resolvase RuvX, partial [Chloroflexi bacterium]|nr:Holliday junction resolvase RuvX [Chloroflexota bacterium]